MLETDCVKCYLLGASTLLRYSIRPLMSFFHSNKNIIAMFSFSPELSIKVILELRVKNIIYFKRLKAPQVLFKWEYFSKEYAPCHNLVITPLLLWVNTFIIGSTT